MMGGPASSVGTVTGYGLNGAGIESQWGRDFSCPDRPWGPPSLLYMGTGSFLGVESSRGMTLTPLPILVLRSKHTPSSPPSTYVINSPPYRCDKIKLSFCLYFICLVLCSSFFVLELVIFIGFVYEYVYKVL
jgi:hypothetical protein